MADLAAGRRDDGPVATADIARHLVRKPQSLSPARDGLIKKGLVYAAERGARRVHGAALRPVPPRPGLAGRGARPGDAERPAYDRERHDHPRTDRPEDTSAAPLRGWPRPPRSTSCWPTAAAPRRSQHLVTELGDRPRAAYPAEAASAADLVVVAIPLRSITNLPKAELAGKTVIDTGNYDPQRDGVIDGLESRQTTTSELLARRAPSTPTSSRRSTTSSGATSARCLGPPGAPDRSALPIAGDDEAAKQQAAALLDTLGYDIGHAGPLRRGLALPARQPGLRRALPQRPRASGPSRPHHPADADTIRARLAEAVPPGQRAAHR